MTQDGAQRLIATTLKAKDCAKGWREVALLLADALAALDINDIGTDVEPYKSAVGIAEKIREDKLEEILRIIKIR